MADNTTLGVGFVLPDTTDIALNVDITGIHAPTFEMVLAWYQSRYREIYGTDIVLDNATKDGQWIAVQARAYYDVVSAAVGVYNAFSPSTAQGVGLSSVVKINGIARAVATRSTCDVTITGDAGVVITNGAIRHNVTNMVWSLPAQVTIPLEGFIVVTATCSEEGAITATPGSLTVINTPTRGWAGVINATAATLGKPIETDGQLRQRQAQSTMIASKSILQGMVGALESITGVAEVSVYENDTATRALNGVPSHSVALVIDGGDAQAIAETIANTKGMGVGTYGDVTEPVTDSAGQTRIVHFSRPERVAIYVAIAITINQKWNSTIGLSIQNAVAEAISAYPAGTTLYASRLYPVASLSADKGGEAYVINSILLGTSENAITQQQIALTYKQKPAIDISQVSITTEIGF
ncbi:baseplate J/gp47 family protein [Entomobacter blattae]|uniref:Baseplate J-like protein n=1 Tax=Entomobacter blattae TaxID=2762277 RepID=A0A7H1NTS1_9PROT|nr:baseplate J/gp47 family protein [Entomobacter blattae]QNT79181.1 Baseplate J-like protein [Entomobacter blattae]